ncbi:hypothetical protein KUTeg_020475 [Tegillarca granosa]|uniref:Uncharacterized protein n=1 Tax=Tegillarca granosa TaxID=220873 RepID=A0ABQ9E806_TEGGR|nr:hypothetical protein KUTeg_020475 [Tegillarca granosa]
MITLLFVFINVILRAQGQKLNNNETLPFCVTPHSPPQVNENRKKLHEENGTNTRVVGDKLVFPNGNIYKDKVTTPKAEDILTIDDEETEKLDKISIKTSSKIFESGNHSVAFGGNTCPIAQARIVNKKMSSNPVHACASHRILVYRTTDKDGTLHKRIL